jgi:uncharacterized protein YeaO (DUF488 family)
VIKIKRIYDPPEKDDGFRILVDRLWPRGVPKAEAKVDLWLKEVAPSDDLRIWFSHDPKKWEGFKKKYEVELEDKRELLQNILQAEKKYKTVTLLYSAKDKEYNQAVALHTILIKVELTTTRF